MHPLYSQTEFDSARSTAYLPLKCSSCSKKFYKQKRVIREAMNKRKGSAKYCSQQCYGLETKTKQEISCKTCGKSFMKLPNQIKKTKNHFCSHPCATTYNNTHKTHGTRRSKLEVWLEERLPSLYPSLEFHFNRKDAINAELDIYIPSLKLAFELNGPFHYEPIYGPEKLAQIQNNDERKFQACLERGIELCWINTSGMSYFKPQKAMTFLNVIQEITDLRRAQ